VVTPDPEITEKYERKYQLFKRLYPALKDSFALMG
jgi:sugar (pentulose or hexulose) kinase